MSDEHFLNTEHLSELERLRRENLEMKAINARYHMVDEQFIQLSEILVAGDHQFDSLRNLLPVGVSVCTDLTCQDIRNNPAAALFLRIGDWENASCSSQQAPAFKIFASGQELLPDQMPIQRSIWFGEQITRMELEFVWEDGIRKTSLWSSRPLIDISGTIVGAIAVFEDITVQKQLEKSLLQANMEIQTKLSELENIYSSAPLGLCLLDTQLRFLRVNKRFAEMNGRPVEDHIGRLATEIVPGMCDLAKETMRQILDTGEPLWNMEVNGVNPAQPGVIRCWTENWLPVKDQQGLMVGVIVTAEETTHRKCLEQELEAYVTQLERKIAERTRELNDLVEKLCLTEERFRLALANAPICMYSQDQNLCYTWIHNPHHGLSEDALGLSDKDLFPVEDYIRLSAMKKRVMETGKSAVEDVKITADGRVFSYDMFVYPAIGPDGRPSGINCVCIDITQRKEAEDALRSSEDKFSKAFNFTPIMMVLATVDEGRILDVNEAWCAGTGYRRDKVIGRTGAELNLYVEPGERLEYMEEVKKYGRVENKAVDMRIKSGEILKCLFWSQLLPLNGELCHISTIIDVSEQRKMEKEIARLDRLNLVGEMAASIGHEIRNPLTTVRGFLQMLHNMECYEKDKLYFTLMIEELDRANAIISEYLGIARNKKIHLVPGSLDQVVQSLNPMLQADAHYRDMEIRLQLCNPPLTIIDESEIRQLILNMARNGMEAMSPGGVLTIGTFTEGNHVILLIKDQGHGLDPDMIEKLGTPFFTTKEHGTGLGMAVCYSIAHRHQARIEIETGPEGTTFLVYFTAAFEQPSLFF